MSSTVCPTPSTVTAQNSGLSSQDYCYLKCWVALVRVGKRLLLEVLSWGFPNPKQEPIRRALQNIPGYSNTKYKVDFNKDERIKIETGSMADFDITLLYTLIQRLCQLVPGSAAITASSMAANQLSSLLLNVKNTRNKFAHPLLGLTETDMANHLNEMKSLFEQVVDEAQNEFQVDVHEANNLKNEISCQLHQIIQSPLPASTIAEQLTQIAEEKVRIILQEGIKDLRQSYKPLFEVSVTPWPFVPLRKNVSDIFMKLQVKFTSSYRLQNRLSEEEATVSVDNLFEVKHLDSSKPGFILLTGPSGVGKSTLFKHIVNSWINSDDSAVSGISIYDLVIYVDCRNTCVTSLNSFLSQIMPNTTNLFTEEEAKNLILGMKCLFLLDNLDETLNQSLPIINELISSPAEVKIIATATQDPGSLIIQKTQNRRPMNLVMEGLSSNCVQDYVQMLHDSLPEELRHHSIDVFFSEILSHENLLHDWLCNPEILSHVFYNWCFSSCSSSRCATLTQILLQSFNLILKKLYDKMVAKSLPGVLELHLMQSKLQTFLLELGRIAISSLKEGTSGLGFKSTSQLIMKCQELGLPANVLLSEFLCFRESFDEKMLQTSVKVNFPSVSFQEFCSAYHVYNHITNSDEDVDLRNLFAIDSLPNSNANKARITNIIKYLIGLISTNDSDLLQTITSQIVEILQNFCEVKKSSQWLQILEEGQGNIVLTGEVLKILDGNWQIENSGITSLVVQLIQSNPPNNLSIVAVKDPSVLPHFQAALEACKSSNQKLKLSLYIYSHFWKQDGQASDDFLAMLTGGISCCQIENFAGRLNSDTFSSIPSTIKRLALQITLEDIASLNAALSKLTELQLLSLNICFESGRANPEGGVPLVVHRRTLLSLDLFGCKSDSLAEQCSTIAAVSDNYARLALRRTSLDGRSVLDLVRRLATAGTMVTALVVGSTAPLPPHKKLNITAAAKDGLGCRDFKWIHL